MEPAGLHAWPLSQRPMVAPAALLQCTFVIMPPLTFVDPGAQGAPQQSLSFSHSSPVGRHPLGGWQMRMPVAAYGRHDRLQQSPPQIGPVPLSSDVAPLQS